MACGRLHCRDMSEPNDLGEVNDLRRWHDIPAKKRPLTADRVPVTARQVAALVRPDPCVKGVAGRLSLLDHYANDESAPTFLAALAGPVAPVGALALHGLACERCRSSDLPVTQVVPTLVRIVAEDPAPRSVSSPSILLRLQPRDPRARHALAATATVDSDPLVRAAGEAALTGHERDAARSRKVMRRRARPGGSNTAKTVNRVV